MNGGTAMDTNEKVIIDDSHMTPDSVPPPPLNPPEYVEEPEYDEYRGVWVLWDKKLKVFREVPPPVGKETP